MFRTRTSNGFDEIAFLVWWMSSLFLRVSKSSSKERQNIRQSIPPNLSSRSITFFRDTFLSHQLSLIYFSFYVANRSLFYSNVLFLNVYKYGLRTDILSFSISEKYIHCLISIKKKHQQTRGTKHDAKQK